MKSPAIRHFCTVAEEFKFYYTETVSQKEKQLLDVVMLGSSQTHFHTSGRLLTCATFTENED